MLGGTPRTASENAGWTFETIAANLSDEQPLRVLDYDGARVFDTVSVRRLDMPVVSEG